MMNLYKAVITLLKNNEKPENNTRDLSIGYLLVALTYSIIGSLFFLTFPDNKGLDGDTTGGHHFCSDISSKLPSDVRLYRSKYSGKPSEE